MASENNYLIRKIYTRVLRNTSSLQVYHSFTAIPVEFATEKPRSNEASTPSDTWCTET